MVKDGAVKVFSGLSVKDKHDRIYVTMPATMLATIARRAQVFAHGITLHPQPRLYDNAVDSMPDELRRLVHFGALVQAAGVSIALAWEVNPDVSLEWIAQPYVDSAFYTPTIFRLAGPEGAYRQVELYAAIGDGEYAMGECDLAAMSTREIVDMFREDSASRMSPEARHLVMRALEVLGDTVFGFYPVERGAASGDDVVQGK